MIQPPNPRPLDQALFLETPLCYMATVFAISWKIAVGCVSSPIQMCSGSETGSYSRLIDSCITQLKAQGPARTCNENKKDDEEAAPYKAITHPVSSRSEPVVSLIPDRNVG